MGRQSDSLGTILQKLADQSARPRYAFMVLNLISEAASPSGKAGPFVERDGERLPVRDWLCTQLMPVSARDRRREKLRARVAESIKDDLVGVPEHDEKVIEEAVAEAALKVGKANVSRAVSDLVKAGLVRRHYAGRITNHQNRGGKRLAVYSVDADALAALRTRSQLI